MKFNVVVALCLFITLGSAVDLDKCAWGESYWCSDLHAAKACGAIKHCTSTVWKNQKLPQDSGEVCAFCEAILDDVRRFIVDNRTEADIIHFLLSACGVIPVEEVSATCKIAVQEFTPELMEMLRQNLDPQVVCSLLKLCKGLEDNVMHFEAGQQRPIPVHVPLKKENSAVVGRASNDYCSDCKQFFTDFKQMITDKTEQEVIEQFLEHDVCVWFGIMAKKCTEMVKAFLPLYLEYIAQFDDPNMICHVIRFCTAEEQHLVDVKIFGMLELLKKNSSDACDTCKTIVAEAQQLDRDPQIEKTIVTFLKTDVCTHFGPSQQQCDSYVDTFAPVVFQFLGTWLDPDARCHQFGFCTKSMPSAISSHGDLVNDMVRQAAPHLGHLLKPHEVRNQDDCAICEYVVSVLKNLLEKNSTEEEIMEALNKVCSILPGGLNASCKDFVNKYVPAIIEMLRQEVDPKVVCDLLGLCSKKLMTAAVRSSNDLCLVCEMIVQYVEALLDQKTSVEEIEKLMKKVCNFLPSSMKSECVNIVNTYGDLIIHLIATEYTPQQACKIAKLCSSAGNPVTEN